jgi:CRISPR-associated protein Csd1
MLIQALNEFFQRAKDDESIDLEAGFGFENINIKIVIDENGKFDSVAILESESKSTKVPRTIRPTNSGEVSEFLCAGLDAVFGLSPNPDKPKDVKKLKNKHEDYWRQIQECYGHTQHKGLNALLAFRQEYLLSDKHSIIQWKKPDDAKKNESFAWWFINESGGEKIKNANSKVIFSVTNGIRENALIQDNQILDYWRIAYQKEKSVKENKTKKGICLVTEKPNVSIAESHLPKIKIMGAESYLVSFYENAFSSYGFEGGYNASTSFSAVEGYTNALTYLLNNKDHRLKIGDDIVLCFWAKESEDSTNFFIPSLEDVTEDTVSDLFKNVKSGIKNYNTIKDDQIYSVALGAVKGRVIVYDWLQTTVEKASDNIQKWWKDLEIEKYKPNPPKEGEKSSLALSRLATATMRRKSKPSKSDKKIHAKIVLELWHSAISDKKPSITYLSKLLSRFSNELASKGVDYTLRNHTRVALLKLIINRYEENNMIEPKLSDTTDSAYNSGRLLAVLAEIQAKAHDYKLNRGLTERFFGSAMKAPAKVFPRLLQLSNHHLDKMKRSEKYKKSHFFLKAKRNEVLMRFQSETDELPNFKTKLTKIEQGRFAIGFFQQMAFDASKAEESQLAKQQKQNQQIQGDTNDGK